MRRAVCVGAGALWLLTAAAQQAPAPADAMLHALDVQYPTPYRAMDAAEVKAVLDRVLAYLERSTPAELVDRTSGAPVTDLAQPHPNAIFKPGDFRLTSYEWGVTYTGMLAAGAATGERRYTDYTVKRHALLAQLTQAYGPSMRADPDHAAAPIKDLLHPHALDDAGALCHSFLKAQSSGAPVDYRPMLAICGDFVARQAYRLADGTLARGGPDGHGGVAMRPLPDTLWLDDLFMAVPTLAYLGKTTGQRAFYDDAARQVLQFSRRMFNPRLGIYMHGYVEGMRDHPEFHWARANGWAVMAMVELLEVLPPDHPQYAAVLDQLRAHIKGLAAYQSKEGLWHQLLDREDTYLETSASAIYTYAIARAVNRGYVEAPMYGPMVNLAWNAVAGKVAANGQIAGICVGTGMAFDPAFYAFRPTSVNAAHGYGPTLLAGAEIIAMNRAFTFAPNDSGLMWQGAGRPPLPAEWVDRDTGHRVVRLSGPTGPIANWYFHNNPFVDKGRMVFDNVVDGVHQIFTLNLNDRSNEQLTFDAAPKRLLPLIAHGTREILYQSGATIYALQADSKQVRKVITLADGMRASVATINADGTLLAGSFAAPEQGEIARRYPKKSDFFDRIYDAHLLNSIFTIDVKTGAMKVVHAENNWLGHVQFSPTDPAILMFCHEGPWHKVDRIWRYDIRDGSTTLMHARSMPMEIAGHEFFAPDGRSIWFDLQRPRGQTFYLAGAAVHTGAPVGRYRMTADEWSIHYAMAPDQSVFAGDGGDATQVAHAKDGMWIYALHPDGARFRSEKLVNMQAHDYRALEPNVHFSPDGKWVIFGATFEGRKETYAVEMARSR